MLRVMKTQYLKSAFLSNFNLASQVDTSVDKGVSLLKTL